MLAVHACAEAPAMRPEAAIRVKVFIVSVCRGGKAGSGAAMELSAAEKIKKETRDTVKAALSRGRQRPSLLLMKSKHHLVGLGTVFKAVDDNKTHA